MSSHNATTPATTASAPNNRPWLSVLPRPAYCDSSVACTHTSTDRPTTATTRNTNASGSSATAEPKRELRVRGNVRLSACQLVRRADAVGSAPDAADGGCDGARVSSSVTPG